MLNAETMKRMIEAEYKSTVDFATKRRDEKLSALTVLCGVPIVTTKAADVPAMPVRKCGKTSKDGLPDKIRAWVANGAPKEFTANQCADEIRADRDRVSILMHGMAHSPTSGVKIVRREYEPRRNIYGKAK